MDTLREVQNAVVADVQDANDYVIMQIGNVKHNNESVTQLSYEIDEDCPQSKKDRIVIAITKKTEELNIPIVTPYLPE